MLEPIPIVNFIGIKNPGYVNILFTWVMEYNQANLRTFIANSLNGLVPISAPTSTGKTMDVAVGASVMGNELGLIYMAASANGAADTLCNRMWKLSSNSADEYIQSLPDGHPPFFPRGG